MSTEKLNPDGGSRQHLELYHGYWQCSGGPVFFFFLHWPLKVLQQKNPMDCVSVRLAAFWHVSERQSPGLLWLAKDHVRYSGVMKSKTIHITDVNIRRVLADILLCEASAQWLFAYFLCVCVAPRPAVHCCVLHRGGSWSWHHFLAQRWYDTWQFHSAFSTFHSSLRSGFLLSRG